MKATGCSRSIALDVFRVAQVNPALQPLESRSGGPSHRARRSRHRRRAARRRRAERGERGDDGRELRGLLVAEARPQTRTVCARSRAGLDFNRARECRRTWVRRRDACRRAADRQVWRASVARRRAFRARSQEGEKRRKEGSITEYSETDDPGRGGRRMPQVRIRSISEYSVTDCQHLQPIGEINQQPSAPEHCKLDVGHRAVMYLFSTRYSQCGRPEGNGRRSTQRPLAVCKIVHSVPKHGPGADNQGCLEDAPTRLLTERAEALR